MIFRKIGIAAVAAATIFGIAAAFPTAATAQYYGGGHWHGGFGWGFGRGLPFRFGAPYSYGYGPYYGYRYDMAPITATDIMTTARINSTNPIPTRTSP